MLRLLTFMFVSLAAAAVWSSACAPVPRRIYTGPPAMPTQGEIDLTALIELYQKRVAGYVYRLLCEASAVDDVCRAIINEAGWGDRFEHGTGHGVGLDIHEAPTVSQLGTAILAPGFVVTVEPGVYVPGHGGVRVEDTLVVTEQGSRNLSGALPREVDEIEKLDLKQGVQ